MDCSLPGSFVHGIFQARVLEWVASAFSIVKSSTYQIPIVGARQAVVALPEGAQKASIYPTVCWMDLWRRKKEGPSLLNFPIFIV